MTGAQHAMLGMAVLVVSLVVGIWGLLAARGGNRPPRPLHWGTLLAIVILAVQILIGLDLWSRGLRPAEGGLALVHLGSPLVALAGALAILFGSKSSRRYALSSFLIFALALISYGIGEMGA